MTAPLVSVVVPTFNGAEFVGAALASVREQSMRDWEVVCVDAGSTDGTVDLVRAIAQQEPRIRLVAEEPGLTPPQARNRALAESRGEFLAPLDQDDTMRPERLSAQVAALRAAPAAAAVGARFARLDRAGLTSSPVGSTPPDHAAWPSSPATVRWLVAVWCPTTTSSTTYRTARLRAEGGFDEAHPLCDDYALLWNLVDTSDVRVLPAVLAGVRQHPEQLSSTRRSRQACEVLLLRQRIVRARLGYRPELDVLAAMHRRSQDDTPAIRGAAAGLLDDLAAWGADRPGIANEDVAWIQAEATRLAARLLRE